MTDHSTSEIRFDREGAWGLVTLTRPKALNSLTLGMVEALSAQLDAWAADDTLRAVILRGEGARAFCAGGDIRAMHDLAKTAPRAAADFFRAEYAADARMHAYAKPIVALMDGITMGGGVGISAPARYRVATERTVWAMPECGIGLVPDIGASWYLNQIEDGTGLWLALTGARLDGAALIEAELATHLVSSSSADDLVQALLAAKLDGDADRAVAAVLRAAHETEPAELDVPSAFSGAPPLDALIAALRGSEEPGAAAALAQIEKGSPTSVALTHRLVTEAPGNFRDAIRREFRVTSRLMEGPDFIEGVRAQVVDKDRAPQWRPARLDAVTPDALDRHFKTPDGGELDLPAV